MLHKIKNGSTVDNLRILSLDGGGIRGVSVARILEELEEHFKQPIHELFDLVIGTSTGGLLSMLLTVPTKEGRIMSAKEVKELYIAKGKEIFKTSRFNVFGVKYLQDGLVQMVSELYDDETTLKHAKTHVGIVVTDEMHGKSIVMNSFRASKYDHDYRHNAKLVSIAKATTAAPTYFEHVIIEEGPKEYIEPIHDETREWYVIDNELQETNLNESIEWYTMDEPVYRRRKLLLEDGGTSNNNPSHLGLKLIKRYLKHHNIKAKNIQLVSLGTGNVMGAETDPEINCEFWNKVKSNAYSVVDRLLLHDPFRVATKAYEVHKKVMNKFREKNNLDSYIRVQFKVDSHQFLNMDDVSEKNITSLLQSANAYIYETNLLESASESGSEIKTENENENENGTKGHSPDFKKLINIIEGSNEIRKNQIVQQTIDVAEKTVETTVEKTDSSPKESVSKGTFGSALEYVTTPVRMIFGGNK